MDRDRMLLDFWRDVASQDADALAKCFTDDACVRWHNTNELFTVGEYIRANCEYPGQWSGEVERMEHAGEVTVTVTRVWTQDGGLSYHATSFFRFCGDKIAQLDEYWGDDGAAPKWREELGIGRKIHEHTFG